MNKYAIPAVLDEEAPVTKAGLDAERLVPRQRGPHFDDEDAVS